MRNKFVGWQSQKNGNQYKIVLKSLKKILKKNIKLMVLEEQIKGVHASAKLQILIQKKK